MRKPLRGRILSFMVNNTQKLDHIFQALSDHTRRSVVARLGRSPATVSELAEPFDMTLPSFLKHIRVLEEAGLLRSRKEGRVRTCAIETRAFVMAETWLDRQRTLWEGRTDRLERFVTSRSGKREHDPDRHES